jgi:hypothetical protein
MSRADIIFRKEQEIEEINRDMRAINPALKFVQAAVRAAVLAGGEARGSNCKRD